MDLRSNSYLNLTRAATKLKKGEEPNLKDNINWVEDIILGISNGGHYKGLLNKCIGNMPEKKLYKYYSFDSEYTLDNIRNDVIYLSNPVGFNDPLDCNIGISTDVIIRLMLPHLLELSGVDRSNEAYDALNLLLFDADNSDLQENSKEAVIADCMKYPQFVSFIQQQKNGDSVSDEQVAALFMDCPELLPNILRAVYSDQFSSLSELDSENLFRYVSSSPHAIKNLLSNASDAKSEEKQIFEIFPQEEDLLQKILNLADHFGSSIDKSKIEEMYANLDFALKNIHTGIGNTFGVSCFTESYANMLMWSHYANKHSGICVEYNFGKLFSINQDLALFPVNYSWKRPLLPLEKVVEFNNGNLTFDENSFSVFIPDIMRALIAKSDVWQYENEWRLIKAVKTDADRKTHIPLISGIYAGANISEGNLASIASIAQQKGVPLYQCAMKNDRYKIVIKQ